MVNILVDKIFALQIDESKDIFNHSQLIIYNHRYSKGNRITVKNDSMQRLS